MLESCLTCDLNCYRAAVYILLELSNIQSSSNKLETDCPDLQFLLCNLPALRVLTKLCYQQEAQTGVLIQYLFGDFGYRKAREFQYFQWQFLHCSAALHSGSFFFNMQST